MAEALRRDFMDDFKRVYKEKGKHDLKAQIPYLAQLADRYKRLGEKDPKERWSDLLKAHTLYNSCAVRSDVKDGERWMQASYDVQKLFWGQEVKATKKDVESVATAIKVRLETLRTELSQKLEHIGKEIKTWHYSFESLESSPDAPEIPFQLCETIQHLSTQCNDSMIDIVHSVIGEAVQTCGEPPCDFSAIAFGSLAKGEATPYSDLEYLFLIEDESPDNISYFEKLAMNSYFIVGNVQETNLKYMSIDELRQDKWFVDKAMSGLKIDGLSENAGNIPTGNNRPGTKKNKLILTPSELAKEYKDLLDNPASDQKQPGDLTDMLTYTREFYNHNNNDLSVKFCKMKAKCTPSETRNSASMHMLQEDIKNYGVVPGEGHMFANSCINLKTDIYRYPSILIFDLKIIHGIEESDTWKTLKALQDKMIISQELYDCLLFLLCAAQYVRFSAYLDRNSQEDSVSILLKNYDTETALTDNSSWHLPHALYFHICLTMLPVKSHITMKLNKEDGLREPVTFNKYEAATKIYSSMEASEATIQCINKRFPCFSNMDIGTIFDLANAYYLSTDCSPSIKLLTQILDSVTSNTMAPDTQAFVTSLGDLKFAIFLISYFKALVLQRCGKIKESLDLFRSIEHLPIDWISRSLYYNSLALIHAGEDQASLAAKYLKLAEDQGLLQETTDETINTAQMLINMGKCIVMIERCIHTEKPDEAAESAIKAMMICEQLYSPGYYPLKGYIHMLLAVIAFRLRNDVTKAESHLCQARRNTDTASMRLEIDTINADMMMAKGDYKSALSSFRNLLIDKNSSSTYSTIDYAYINLQLGICYMATGAWPAAEEFVHRAKGLYMEYSRELLQFSLYRAKGPSWHPMTQLKICETDYHLVMCLFKKGKAKEALIAIGHIVEELCHLSDRTPSIIDFLSDIVDLLRRIIDMLTRKGKFIGPYKLSASACFMALSRIHMTCENDELGEQYYIEAVGCNL